MIVTFWKGVFVVDVLDEKGMLKKAGFALHEPTMCNLAGQICKACRAKIGRRYWSDKVEAATRLKNYCNDRALKVMKEHLNKLEKSRAVNADIQIPAPEGLEYLGYQKAGVAYALQRKDTLIGDEPGLGKTIQALGFVNYLKPKNVIVICPNTVVFNWKNEALKWLIDDYEIWPVRSRNDELPEKNGLFVIANYEKITGNTPLSRSLKREWDIGIFDEAHMIKNPLTSRSQAIIGVNGLMNNSKRTLFLSGTPIENYPREIWPIAAAICPAKFGNWIEFARRYCGLHTEERRGEFVAVADGGANLAELQQRLRASFMVRRLKQDVLKELPPKRRQLVVLEDSQIDWAKHPQFVKWQKIYEQKYEDAFAKMEAAKTDEEYRLAAKAMEKVTNIAFEEMSAFRHETALVKLPLCIKYLDDLLASGLENVVVFANHIDVIEKLSEHFEGNCVVVTGSTPTSGPRSREVMVKDFQEGKKKIFIGQLRAAGMGITLTTANTVVFVEIDWVPAVLSQAEDRLCRIGQKKMVHVIHLILGNTLDANMVKKTVTKQEIIEKALDHLPGLKSKKSA